MILHRVRLIEQDFAGQDLRHADMSHSTFENCVFDDANLTEADCEASAFPGCSFRRSICYRTNFKDAALGGSIFEPRDAYGITVTLTCDTFRGMQVSQLWWYSWLLFATQMQPAYMPVLSDIKGQLIAAIGAERYVKLTKLFERRQL